MYDDTEAQAALRKNIRETLASTADSSTVISYALGAASACWDGLDQAGVFRTDLMEVVLDETIRRLNQPQKLTHEPIMREIYIFDEKVVDRVTMFSKTPRPFKVHYHRHTDTCTELCEVIERDE